MKKLLSLALVLAMVVSCISMVSFVTNAADAKVIANGDCEAGKTADWGVFNGGSTTIIEELGNPTNKVAKFVPTGVYNSVAYNVFAGIVKDEANGYNGKGAGTGEFVEIAPGESKVLTYTMEVDNGKVAVGDTDVDISKFFARFDVKAEDGSDNLVKGTKITITAIDSADYEGAASIKAGGGNTWSSEAAYSTSGATGTGDMLPVALIATVTVASVALIVASKKRKED